MVTDGQVKELRRLLLRGKSLAGSARMTQMSEKTARDYRDDQRLPSQRKAKRKYRTRVDPFVDVWELVQKRLQDEPRLKAKTLFEWLQDSYPGKFPDSTRRTFFWATKNFQFCPIVPQLVGATHPADAKTVCTVLASRKRRASDDQTVNQERFGLWKKSTFQQVP